jgi:hypothetical protein
MAERVSFSDQEQNLEEIAHHHADLQDAIFQHFSGSSPIAVNKYALEKLDEARDRCLSELDLTSSMSIMAAIEAAIRVDYLSRVYARWRDPLSRALKELHKAKKNRAKIDSDLIYLWREKTQVSKPLLAEVVAAFSYRHWLAHGRYWLPKLGRQYDYLTLYGIAQEFFDAMKFHLVGGGD